MILHPALWTLLYLRQRSKLRRLRHELGTARGALLFLLGLTLLGLAVLPLVLTLDPAPPLQRETLRQTYPFALLMIVLMGQLRGLANRAIYFTPGEVDLLFPAPFRRRELLLYRVLTSLPGLAVAALLASLVLLRFGTWWPAVLAGALLSLLLVQLLGMNLSVLRETVEERLFSGAQRVAALAVAVLLVGLALHALSQVGWQRPGDALEALQAAWPVRVLLAPFLPFAQLVTATAVDPTTLLWLTACLIIDAALLIVLVRLDARYLETAARISGQRGLAPHRSGGRAPAGPKVRLRLPAPPVWQGVGLVAWMQLTVALRSLRMLLETALLVTLIGGLIYYASSTSGGSRTDTIGAAVVVWATLVVSNTLRFDLRSHLDQLAYLKTLPLPVWGIVLGQLVTPALITLAFQLPLAALWAAQGNATLLLLVALYAAPANLLLYAIENLLFLLYPISPKGRGPGDFQFLGRQTLLLLIKLIALTVAVLLAAGVGALLYGLVGPNWLAVGGAIWLVLTAQLGVLVRLLADALRRFEPGRHAATEG